MARISRDITTDRRTNSDIRATVHSTVVDLYYNNIVIKLTRVEARRLGEVLTKATAIQESHEVDKDKP